MKLKITILDGTSTATHKIVSNPIRVRAHAGRGGGMQSHFSDLGGNESYLAFGLEVAAQLLFVLFTD